MKEEEGREVLEAIDSAKRHLFEQISILDMQLRAQRRFAKVSLELLEKRKQLDARAEAHRRLGKRRMRLLTRLTLANAMILGIHLGLWSWRWW